jgi:RNA ligase (TIGR02306 family)
MSTFKVSVETLDRVWKHPGADLLELASVAGMSFQFVVLKDKHKAGDTVLYFPIDSLMPPELIETLGLTGRLAGKEQNRLKTIKLRKAISQGLVSFPKDLSLTVEEAQKLDAAGKLTEHFGIVKYDPPPIPAQNAELIRLPEDVGVYDIEGADRFSSVLEALLDQPVRITEKLEGTNWSVTVLTNGEVMVNQRNHSIREHEGKEHYFWKVAREDGLIDLAKKIQELMLWAYQDDKPEQVTLRGELIGPGVQKNLYKLPRHQVHIFDVLIGTGSNTHYLNGRDFDSFVGEYLNKGGLQPVPIIANNVILRDWLDGRSVQEASNGKSLLNMNTRREGIVITPMKEQDDPNVGRLILKMRSPEYLAKSDL